MINKTLYCFLRFTEGDARERSDALFREALDAFWQKTGNLPEEVRRTPKGKPYFPSGRAYISVTHTGSLYACAFAELPLGIDAERADESRPRIAEEKFSPEERALPFSFVWCAKEAVAKLVGEGLSITNQVAVRDGFAEYGGKRYILRERLLGSYRLLIAAEEGRDFDGVQTLSEE